MLQTDGGAFITFAQRANPNYHNYFEPQSTSSQKGEIGQSASRYSYSARIVPPKRDHVVRNKTSLEVRIRRKSGLRPQLSGFHKRGFQATAENAI